LSTSETKTIFDVVGKQLEEGMIDGRSLLLSPETLVVLAFN
jgi:hypothetical protein